MQEKLEPLFIGNFSVEFRGCSDILNVLVNSYEHKDKILNVKFSLMYNKDTSEFVPLKHIRLFEEKDIVILNFFDDGNVFSKVRFIGCKVKQTKIFNKGDYHTNKKLQELDVDFEFKEIFEENFFDNFK